MNSSADSILRQIDFTNCKIVVKDYEDDSKFFSSEIVEQNKAYQFINIKVPFNISWDLKQLIIIVFAEGKVYQFLGNSRNNVKMGVLEVAIFKSSIKNDRKYQRYNLKIEAEVSSVLIDKKMFKLKVPFPVTILNVSTTGIMFQTMSGSFQNGDIVHICAVGMDDNTQFTVEVVRRKDISLITTQYGCKLVVL